MNKDKTTPPAWQNERATGARKLEARPDLKNPDIIHTGDPDDEPRKPYGLTEPPDEQAGGPEPAPVPPSPIPGSPPVKEPDPDRLPDEEPVPNPDENDLPPKRLSR